MIHWKIGKDHPIFDSVKEKYTDIMELKYGLNENAFERLCEERENIKSYIDFSLRDFQLSLLRYTKCINGNF